MSNKYFYLNTSKENTKFLQSNWNSVFGKIPKVLGVVIHDSASGINATAESVARYTSTTMENANYHNVVDSSGNCYAVVDMKSTSYHTGDTYGNQNFIGVEVANSLTGGNFKNQGEKDTYFKALNNSCKMVADYLVYNGLNENNVKFHKEFVSTACPYTMKMYYGSYEKAQNEVKKIIKKHIQTIKNNGVEIKETGLIWTAKIAYDFQKSPNKSKYKLNGEDTFFLIFTRDVVIYRDFECTKKDGSIFKKGDGQLSQSIPRRNKKGDIVHKFTNENGTYYFEYGWNRK